MSWMTKDDEIQILKSENRELRSIIEVIKKELIKEREAVDSLVRTHGRYDEELESCEWKTCCSGRDCGCLGKPIEPEYYEYSSRQVARFTQKNRKVVL